LLLVLSEFLAQPEKTGAIFSFFCAGQTTERES